MTADTHTPTAPETAELEKLLAEATPGPLRVEQDTTLIWGACNPDDTSNRGMGYPIAECRITAMSSWAKGPDADAGEANARGMAMWRDIAADLIRLRAEVATMRASDARMRDALEAILDHGRGNVRPQLEQGRRGDFLCRERRAAQADV